MRPHSVSVSIDQTGLPKTLRIDASRAIEVCSNSWATDAVRKTAMATHSNSWEREASWFPRFRNGGSARLAKSTGRETSRSNTNPPHHGEDTEQQQPTQHWLDGRLEQGRAWGFQQGPADGLPYEEEEGATHQMAIDGGDVLPSDGVRPAGKRLQADGHRRPVGRVDEALAVVNPSPLRIEDAYVAQVRLDGFGEADGDARA